MKRKGLVMAALAAIVLCISGAAVYARTTVSVINHLSTGTVDIGVKKWEKTGQKEQPFEGVQNILPGQTVSYIPRIYNYGNDCYVRAKIMYENIDPDVEEMMMDAIFGMDDQWAAGGDGYFYYVPILTSGETIDVFQGIQIPEDLPQEKMEGKTFSLQVSVEAIQARNMEPDYDMEYPWGIVAIQEGVSRDGVTVSEAVSSQSFEIRYEGTQLVTNQDDFFVNFPILMPGDTYSDSVLLDNNGTEDIRLYFKSEALEESALLDQVEIKITADIGGQNETVYEGLIRAEELTEGKLLGVIKSGTSGSVRFTIHVPEELTNEYALLNSAVRWTFYAEPIQSAGIASGTGGANSAPKTGDTLDLLGWILLSAGALGIAGGAFMRRKECMKRNGK